MAGDKRKDSPSASSGPFGTAGPQSHNSLATGDWGEKPSQFNFTAASVKPLTKGSQQACPVLNGETHGFSADPLFCLKLQLFDGRLALFLSTEMQRCGDCFQAMQMH